MGTRELLVVNFAQKINASESFPVALRQSEPVKHQRAVVKRETVRYVPQNSSYVEGQTMYIKVTSDQGLIVPSSARLRFKLTNELADGKGDESFPNLVTSIFDRGQLSMGGQLAEDINQDLGVAVWAVASQTMSRDYYDNDALYTMRNKGAKVEDNKGTGYFEVPLSLLFGSFRQYKYLPLRNMENGVEIRLSLKSGTDAMYISQTATDAKYTIDEIELFVDMVYLDESLAQSMDTLIKSGTEKLVYPIHTWYVDKRASSGKPVEVQFNRSTSHCRNLIFFNRTNANIDESKSGYELKADKATELSIQIGGTKYPTYGNIKDVRSAYSVSRSSLGVLGHVNGNAGLLHKSDATNSKETNEGDVGYLSADVDYEVGGFSLIWSFEKLRETEDLDSDALNITGMPIVFRETLNSAEARQNYLLMEYTRFVILGGSMISVEE